MTILFESSQIRDGNMSLKWGDETEVGINREKWLAKLGLKLEDCVLTSLVHGDEVAIVGTKDEGKIHEVDGLVTTEPHVGLWMVTADCLPVVFYDLEKNILGLAHLGWRGVDLKLAQKMIVQMQKLGAGVSKLKIWIGPGVRKETYIKHGETKKRFLESIDMEQWKNFLEDKSDGGLALNLVGLVQSQLEAKGVLTENIEVSPIDTVKDTNYFSQYRSYATHETQGRFATVAMLKS